MVEYVYKFAVPDFLSLSHGNFRESLTPRLPLMQALCARSKDMILLSDKFDQHSQP